MTCFFIQHKQLGSWRILLACSLGGLGFFLGTQNLKADTMTGGAAAAVPSPSGIGLNPANLAFVDESFFDISPRIFEINKVLIRYPNYDTISWDQRGISPLAALSFAPRTGDKKQSRFRFLINEIVPPLTIPFSISGIPVLILDQLNTLDVKTTVNIRGALGGAFAVKFSPRWGMGISGNYRSAILNNKLRVRGENSDLAELRAGVDLMTFTVGLRFIPIPGKLALGLASAVYSSQKLTNEIKGDITNAAGGALTPTEFETTQIVKTLLIGSHYVVNAYTSFRLDLSYTRANPNEERFSLVDLENQPLESYDSLGVRVGAKIWTNHRDVFAFGYTFEPATVGSGERGPGTTTGFGIQDYVLVLAGLDELKPFHRVVVSGGRSFGFEKGIPRWNTMIGLAYQEASLGISQDGEQPGAFVQRKIFIPGQLTYRF